MDGAIIKFSRLGRKCLSTICVLSVLLFSGSGLLSAAPARSARITVVQPDGVSFTALLSGDEYVKVMTTLSGVPVIQEEDGFYCYAWYDSDACLRSTGERVGNAPASVALSSDIPYDLLKKKAALRRLSSGRRPGRRAGIAPGTVNVPVLLVSFSDLPFTYTKDEFSAMLNEPGYSVNGSTGSARDYFRDQFMGRNDFNFDVSDVIDLPRSYRYYGKNDNLDAAGSDIQVGRMIYDACSAAANSIDFSKYDNDGDGEVDGVILIFAGGDEASGAGADHVWSKSGFLDEEKGLSLACDGVRINCYACTSEMLTDGSEGDLITNIGTFCHEFCHILGLPDFYDRNGLSEALWGRTSIMDRGNLNNDGRTPPNLNAIERHILGISVPDTLKSGQYALRPVNEAGRYLYSGTETEGEYFLFECREATGWDAYIGGSGMLVYHIDSSLNYVYNARACDRWLMTGDYANTVNSHKSHQCADLQEADPSVSFMGTATPDDHIRRIFYPSGENDSFTPASEPAFESWSGVESEVSVTEIKYESGTVRFQVYDNEYSMIPSVNEIYVDEFQDAAIVAWTADTEIHADVVLADADGTLETLEVEPYEYGKYSVTFEGLEPATDYTVGIGYSVGGISGRVRIRRVSTHPESPYQPYIYLYNVARNNDGSFPAGTRLPLRLYNAYGAEKIVWTMDGNEISTDASGYYVPGHSGVLKAVAVFPDGTEYRVSKYIEIERKME